MQHVIQISQPINNNLGSSYSVLLSLLKQLSGVKPGDSVIIDLQQINFAYSSLFLPIAAKYQKMLEDDIRIEFINNSCGYLNTVFFPHGLNPLLQSNWHSSLSYYQNRTYLSMCSIPSAKTHEKLRDDLIATFGQILRKQLNLSSQIQIAINYLISEAFDNIVEHAKVENGWIMVQNYPNQQFLDVCITDTGLGILGSYINNNFLDIKTDKEAIYEAINGRSTKNFENSRGYGIRTSRKMLVNGLKGKYILMSGNAFYVLTGDQELINELNDCYHWQGTILALRIPKTEPSGFNYVRYLE